jgi:small subunit ribosomal protein S33
MLPFRENFNFLTVLGTLSVGMAAAIPSRLKQLYRLRCSIFQTTYNPNSLRTGAKYLRARLRGPSMVKYYPHVLNLSQIAREFPQLELVDEDEEQRWQDIEDRKERGKGAPKKAKTKGPSFVLL